MDQVLDCDHVTIVTFLQNSCKVAFIFRILHNKEIWNISCNSCNPYVWQSSDNWAETLLVWHHYGITSTVRKITLTSSQLIFVAFPAFFSLFHLCSCSFPPLFSCLWNLWLVRTSFLPLSPLVFLLFSSLVLHFQRCPNNTHTTLHKPHCHTYSTFTMGHET